MGEKYIEVHTIDKTNIDKLFNIRCEWDQVPFQESIQMIINLVNEAIEEKQKALGKVKEYEESINADIRVQKLTAELQAAKDSLYRGFPITATESEQITAWKDRHDVEQHNLTTLNKKLNAGGAIGGRYHYSFCPTSIGVVGECICGQCEKKAFEEAKGNREKYKELLKKYNAIFEFSEL